MSWEAWFTLIVIIATVAVMARELVPPALAILIGVVVLLLAGVVDGEQALSGFSNEAPYVVGSLLILARAVDVAGLLDPVVNRIFGASTGRTLLARLLFPLTLASGFLNNTTLVAMSVPPVIDVASRRQLPVSKFLIPISYAAVLGGVITVIGTSTNLTVIGLMREAGLQPIGIFDLVPVGLPIALAGTGVMVLLADRLLPDRGSVSDAVGDEVREFSVTMMVRQSGPLDGVSVEDGGLRHLQGVYLAQIQRGEEVIAPVARKELLRGGDLLLFVGRVTEIVDLQRHRGLVSSEYRQLTRLDRGGHGFFEVVVGSESALVGRTIQEIGFRGRYRAAVLAVHRAGSRIDEKLGDIRLRMGDTLLILGDEDFRTRWRDSRDFLVIAPLGGIPPTQQRKGLLVAAIGLAFILVTSFELIPLLNASLGVAVVLIATRVLTLRQARNALDLDILVLIAAAFGLGAAVTESGLGDVLATGIVSGMSPLGTIGALAGVLIATMALTELISNNAAAALMFPIAVATGTQLGVDVTPFIVVIMLGASLSFLTPIGYQTNLLVYGLGNYKFSDYTRLGIPLNLVSIVLILLLVPRVFPL